MISCLRCAQLYRLLISLCLTFSYFTILSFFFNDLLTQTSVLILLCCRTIWLMDHRVYLLRLASMTPHKMMHHRATLVWQMPTNFSLRFLLIPMLFSGGSLCRIILFLGKFIGRIIAMPRCEKYLATRKLEAPHSGFG